MFEDQSDTLKEEGNVYFRKNDYISALVKYTEALCSNSRNPVLYSNRASTFLKLNSLENALNDCNQGLKLVTNKDKGSTYIKLLWRKSIALRRSGDLENALETIKTALNVKPTSKELQHELEAVDYQMQKRNSKLSLVEIDIPNQGILQRNSDTLYIPIQEVQKIPTNFYSPEAPEDNEYIEDNPPEMKNQIKNQNEINAKRNLTTSSFPSSSNFEFDKVDFPLKPTVQFLLSLKDKPKEFNAKSYRYVIEIDPEHYCQIFGNSGIDPSFLNFMLDSTIYVLEKNQLDLKQKILNLFSMCTKLPRFSLTSMFVDTKTVNRLHFLFQERLNESFDNYWL